MKKTIILTITLLLTGTFLFAQKKINEGVITYTVQWIAPEEMNVIVSNLPTELKVYFKGDSSSMRTESSMFSTRSILNTKKQYERILIEVPMMAKKFSVIFTSDDQEKIQEQLPDFAFNKSESLTKNIAGYTAVKYEVTDKKTNQRSVAWFTKDIEIVQNPLSRFYDKSYGFPVEFNSFIKNLTIKAVVKDIKVGSIPAGTFKVGNDYEEITFDQLVQFSGGIAP